MGLSFNPSKGGGEGDILPPKYVLQAAGVDVPAGVILVNLEWKWSSLQQTVCCALFQYL